MSGQRNSIEDEVQINAISVAVGEWCRRTETQNPAVRSAIAPNAALSICLRGECAGKSPPWAGR